MLLEWLYDYITLLETKNFSEASALRGTSQPTFSRRIMALEEWLGVALLAREKKHFKLTRTAQAHDADFKNLIHSIEDFRNRLQVTARDENVIIFTTQHALAVTLMPQVFKIFKEICPDYRFKLLSLGKLECDEQFRQGKSDVMIVYENALPLAQSHQYFLGETELVFVGTPDIMTSLMTGQKNIIPLISYPDDSSFGTYIGDTAIKELRKEYEIDIIYKTPFAMDVREMLLAGFAVAWVPLPLVEEYIKTGRLQSHSDKKYALPLYVVMHVSESLECDYIQEMGERLKVSLENCHTVA